MAGEWDDGKAQELGTLIVAEGGIKNAQNVIDKTKLEIVFKALSVPSNCTMNINAAMGSYAGIWRRVGKMV